MLTQLGWTGDIGPLVSMGAAALSALCLWLNFRLSRRMADRSLNLEAQKMLLEINRQLISDPWLWSIYDDHPVRTDPEFGRKCGRSGLFQAKLQAFAYLKLNMFEVILAEVPEPARHGLRNASNVWLAFFHYTIAKSSAIRDILERPDAAQLYNPVLIGLYEEWKKAAAAAGGDAAAPGA
jgi:hypothetical protein